MTPKTVSIEIWPADDGRRTRVALIAADATLREMMMVVSIVLAALERGIRADGQVPLAMQPKVFDATARARTAIDDLLAAAATSEAARSGTVVPSDVHGSC